MAFCNSLMMHDSLEAYERRSAGGNNCRAGIECSWWVLNDQNWGKATLPLVLQIRGGGGAALKLCYRHPPPIQNDEHDDKAQGSLDDALSRIGWWIKIHRLASESM